MKIASQSVYVALRPTCFEHADLLGSILVRCNGENCLFLVAYKLNYICVVVHGITFVCFFDNALFSLHCCGLKCNIPLSVC